MSAGVTWLIEDKLLLLNSWGKLNVDEMNVLDLRITDMLDNSPEPLVHGIHDHTRADSIPSAKDLMQIKAGKHPRVGWLIIVGLDNKLMKFFVSATGQVLNIRLRFMDTVEEALAFLQDIDTTLPDLAAIDLTAADARIHEAAVSIENAS